VTLLEEVISALIFILPAYVANAAPLIIAPLIKEKHPVDFGVTMSDGKRLLGDTKTWEGFFAGVVLGAITGGLMGRLALGSLLGFGAMLGDLGGSFIKRRLGLEPGSPTPLLDQLDFLAGALLLSYLAGMAPDGVKVLALIVLTPPIHVATNVLAYLIGIKDKPY